MIKLHIRLCFYDESRHLLQCQEEFYIFFLRFKRDIPSKQALYAEIDLLEEALSKLGSPLVFSHNDILLKNVVHNEAEGLVECICINQFLHDSTVPRDCGIWHELEHGNAELPHLVQKIVEKPTFHGIGEIFHFLSAEFRFLEHRTSIF